MTDEDRELLYRIERKLDVLIAALADEEPEAQPSRSLDGDLLEGGERDQNQSLG